MTPKPRPRSAVSIATALLLLATIPSSSRAQWAIEPTPALRVESTTSDGTVQFASVLTAMRMADGTIVIADAQDAMLRVADGAGRVVRSFGRQGQGPGEFRQLAWAGGCGADTTYAWDGTLGRVAVFSTTSGYARQFTVEGALGSVLAACASDGSFAVLTANQQGPSPAHQSGDTPDGSHWEIRRMMGSLRVVDRTGAPRFQVPDLLWADAVGARLGANGRVGGFFRPLGDRTVFDFAGGQLVVGETDSATVARFDATGAVTTSFRVPVDASPPSRAQYEAATIPANAMAPVQMHANIMELARVVPMPARLPPFSTLRADPAGNVWLVRSLPGDPRTRFDIHDRQGRRVAALELPGAFTLHEVGLDYVLGSIESEDGEPVVVLHRLRRP